MNLEILQKIQNGLHSGQFGIEHKLAVKVVNRAIEAERKFADADASLKVANESVDRLKRENASLIEEVDDLNHLAANDEELDETADTLLHWLVAFCGQATRNERAWAVRLLATSGDTAATVKASADCDGSGQFSVVNPSHERDLHRMADDGCPNHDDDLPGGEMPSESVLAGTIYGGRVSGVGPDAPTTVNERGGKQSASLYRCDLLPPLASLEVSKVLKHGADKYGPNNWHKISLDEHLNHMLVHVLAYLAGDGQDDHLGHMACRALMALEIALMNNHDERKAA